MESTQDCYSLRMASRISGQVLGEFHFDRTVEITKREVDAEMASGIHVPLPVDFSGGYTHERHKRNFFIAEKAGALFQILGDEKYAAYLRDMLFEYAEMYPKLPLHPKERSYARGKLFWQCLNDANWLLYMSLAYDAIYDWLSEEDREFLDTQLFRPFADFLSSGNPQFFNRVHNHSTWGTAAVGMLGLVLDDSELIERALYGLKDDGLELGALDDDGGFIKVADQRVGFLANLEEPFRLTGITQKAPITNVMRCTRSLPLQSQWRMPSPNTRCSNTKIMCSLRL